MIFGSLADSAVLSCSFATGSLAVTCSLPRETKIQPSVPMNLMPFGKSPLIDHRDAVGVQAVGLEVAVDVPQAFGRELRAAPDLDRTGELGVHAPVRASRRGARPSR